MGSLESSTGFERSVLGCERVWQGSVNRSILRAFRLLYLRGIETITHCGGSAVGGWNVRGRDDRVFRADSGKNLHIDTIVHAEANGNGNDLAIAKEANAAGSIVSPSDECGRRDVRSPRSTVGQNECGPAVHPLLEPTILVAHIHLDAHETRLVILGI